MTEREDGARDPTHPERKLESDLDKLTLDEAPDTTTSQWKPEEGFQDDASDTSIPEWDPESVTIYEAPDPTLPQWEPEKDPETYEKLKPLLMDKDVNAVDSFLEDLLKSKGCRLGPLSFTTTLHLTPYKHTQSPLVHTVGLKSDLVAEYLLRRYSHLMDVNRKEWVYYSGSWTLTSLLHIASASNMLKTAQLLVEAGAIVDIRNCCLETPLHTGCRCGSIDTLEYLLSQGANIDVVNRFGDTALVSSILPLNYKMSKFLLDKGADYNIANLEGYTAMHVASKLNDVKTLKELLAHGASPLFHEADPSDKTLPCPVFHAICCWGFNPDSMEVTEILTSQPGCPISCKIDALLLVASYHRDRDVREQYWRRAITLREEHKVFPIPLPPVMEYGHRTEVMTNRELSRVLESSLEELYLSVLVQERCLGFRSDRVASTVRQVATTDTRRFEPLWFRYLDMVIESWACRPKSIHLRAVGILLNVILSECSDRVSQMLLFGPGPDFRGYIDFGIRGLDIMRECMARCVCGNSLTISDFSGLLWHIWSMLSDWLISERNSMQERLESFNEVGKQLVSKHLYVKTTTLLHIFLAEIYMRLDGVMPLRKYINLVPFLLQWGADSVIDTPLYGGFRPIHLAVLIANKRDIGGVPIVPDLLECGAHLDAVSPESETPLQLCTNDATKDLLSARTPLPLMCWAAHALVREKIPYDKLDCLPAKMKEFVALHAPVNEEI